MILLAVKVGSPALIPALRHRSPAKCCWRAGRLWPLRGLMEAAPFRGVARFIEAKGISTFSTINAQLRRPRAALSQSLTTHHRPGRPTLCRQTHPCMVSRLGAPTATNCPETSTVVPNRSCRCFIEGYRKHCSRKEESTSPEICRRRLDGPRTGREAARRRRGSLCRSSH